MSSNSLAVEASLTSEAPEQKFRPLAPAWHTLAVLAVIGISAYNGMQRAAQLRGTGNLYRMTIYLHTIRFEWLMLALVLFGLWRGRSSVFEALGERWRSVRQFLLDAGIGMLLLVVTIVVSSIAGGHTSGKDPAVQFLLPQSGREIAMWVLLSFSAGVCEEAVYRGYLQKQFMAWTRSAAAGIILSGMLFGAAHIYQGFGHAAVIALTGVTAGVAAHWRRSVRPGMIAHTLQDVLGGLLNH
jgi:membrane protease YdiL (CAAX protease family)